MANRFQKGLGGAATGYAYGGPIGAGIGGLLGFLGGSDKVPELGDFEFSPEAMRSYNFADINLEQMNPVMYRKLLENDALLNGMREQLASRREGATANEQRQRSDYLNQQGSAMASSGLVGTPMGNAMMADAAARMQAQIQDRAFQEYMALQGGVANQQNANMNAYAGAQGQVLDQFGRNRNAALQMDQLRNQRDMAQYGEDQAALAASNAQWGSMLNNGMMMAGAGKSDILGLGDKLGEAYQYGKDLFSRPSVQTGGPNYGVGLGYGGPVQQPSPGFGYRQPAPQQGPGFGYGQAFGVKPKGPFGY